MTDQQREDLRCYRYLLSVIAPLCLIYGILSGVRWPSRWAITNLILDYHFGFSKRGLFGELLSLLLTPPYSYASLAIISFGIFLLSVCVLLHLFLRERRLNPQASVLFALFFTSAGFVFLVHDVGYLDHIGLLVGLSALLLGGTFSGLCIRLLMCLAATLVHEAFFFIFLPPVLFDVWLEKRKSGLRTAIASVLIIAAPCAALTLQLGNETIHAPETEIATYYNGRLADIRIRDDAIKPVVRNGRDNLLIMRDLWRSSPGYVLDFIESLLVTAPLSLLFCWVGSCLLRDHGADNGTRALALMCPLSPLALHVVAWDQTRFNSLIQVTSFLVLLSVIRRCGGLSLPRERCHRFLLYSALVLAVNLGSEVRLFDGYVMQKLPFAAHVRYLLEAATGRAPWMRLPSQ